MKEKRFKGAVQGAVQGRFRPVQVFRILIGGRPVQAGSGDGSGRLHGGSGAAPCSRVCFDRVLDIVCAAHHHPSVFSNTKRELGFSKDSGAVAKLAQPFVAPLL